MYTDTEQNAKNFISVINCSESCVTILDDKAIDNAARSLCEIFSNKTFV